MKPNYLSNLKMGLLSNLKGLRIRTHYEVLNLGDWLLTRLLRLGIGTGYGVKYYDQLSLILKRLLSLFRRQKDIIISTNYIKRGKYPMNIINLGSLLVMII